VSCEALWGSFWRVSGAVWAKFGQRTLWRFYVYYPF
jgi:hypothetical protein